MKSRYQALVIGAGHNGLVHAAYLARAGLKVGVLERRPRLGGATITEEIFPGFHYLPGSYLVSLLRPQVIEDLKLAQHGLELIPLETTWVPLPNGDSLAEWPEQEQTCQDLARHSLQDAENYPRFCQRMLHLAALARPLLDLIPPDPTSLSLRELERMAHWRGVLGQMRRLDLESLFQLCTLSIGDFLDQWFTTPALKAMKATSGIIGSFVGVRSPGSGYVALHHYLGQVHGVPRSWAFPKGGTGSVSQALARAARALGVDIVEQAPVSQILTHQGQAYGVALEDGREVRADRIISSADASHTFLRLLPPQDLPPDFLEEIRAWRTVSPACKVNLALDGLPQFSALPPGGEVLLRGSIEIAPSLDYLERAFDEAKYGGYSQAPFMDALIPSLLDPSMAPPGQHVMSLFVQYASSELDWTPQRKERFLGRVIETLSHYAPDLPQRILHAHLMSPADIEALLGITGGHIFHGEMALDQILCLRPLPGWAHYRTPIRHLWLCGSSTHPGGCITGAPGRNAALELLQEWSA